MHPCELLLCPVSEISISSTTPATFLYVSLEKSYIYSEKLNSECRILFILNRKGTDVNIIKTKKLSKLPYDIIGSRIIFLCEVLYKSFTHVSCSCNLLNFRGILIISTNDLNNTILASVVSQCNQTTLTTFFTLENYKFLFSIRRDEGYFSVKILDLVT